MAGNIRERQRKFTTLENAENNANRKKFANDAKNRFNVGERATNQEKRRQRMKSVGESWDNYIQKQMRKK